MSQDMSQDMGQGLDQVGPMGATVSADAAGSVPLHAFLFGEDQGRYLLAVAPSEVAGLEARARQAGVPLKTIGVTGGDALLFPGEPPMLMAALGEAHGRFLPALMEGVL